MKNDHVTKKFYWSVLLVKIGVI